MTDAPSIPYLSSEWIRAADAALASLDPLPEALTIGYTVTGGPPGTVAYSITLGPDRVSAAEGTDNAQLSLTLGWELAVAIAKGERSAQRAFLDGSIALDGPPGLLLGHGDRLTAVDDALADLRARSSFHG